MNTVARSTQTVTINSGALVSDNIVLVGTDRIGIAAPVITSGTLYLQVGDVADTYHGRLWDPRSQGAFFWNLAAGSAALVPDILIRPYRHARLEMDNSQVNLREFTITKARG